MRKSYYNSSKIVKMVVGDDCEDNYYSYKKGIKIFGLILKKEGVYSVFGYYVDPSDYDKRCIVVRDNRVYKWPYVRIYYEGEYGTQIDFKDAKEALKYASDLREFCRLTYNQIID